MHKIIKQKISSEIIHNINNNITIAFYNSLIVNNITKNKTYFSTIIITLT